MFIQTYEKPIQLKSMEEEKGVVKFRYNELFKTLKIKVYFRNKRVYSYKKKIDNKKSLELLQIVRNKNVSCYKEFSLSVFCCTINAYDEKEKQVGDALNGYIFKDLCTDEKIEKIIVHKKLKNG